MSLTDLCPRSKQLMAEVDELVRMAKVHNAMGRPLEALKCALVASQNLAAVRAIESMNDAGR